MLWRHTLREDADRNPVSIQGHQLYQGLIIAGLMKHFALGVAAIDNVTTDIAHRGAYRAGLNSIYLGQRLCGKRKEECPYYSAL